MNSLTQQAAGRGLFLLFALAIVCFLVALGIAPATSLARLKPAPVVAPVSEEPDRSQEAAELHPAQQVIRNNPIHDPSNPDAGRLQTMEEATRLLPKDALGFPDWMRALRSGDIAPRAGLRNDARMNVLDLDVVMRNTKEMPYVRFPHLSHTLWLDCSNCHPAPFSTERGVNRISMSDIFRGQYCGVCHDRVAFITFFSCNRCHSVAQDTVPGKAGTP